MDQGARNFSDFLLNRKKTKSNVFNQFDESQKIEIYWYSQKLDNLDDLILEYDLLVPIQDKEKLFNILLSIKDTKLKLSILNTFLLGYCYFVSRSKAKNLFPD